MEALAKLIADITEFLVGGVLFLGALALLAQALFATELQAVLRLPLPNAAASAVTLGLFALVYAFGVMAEGISRMLLEWRLTALTVKQPKIASVISIGPDRAEAAPGPAPVEDVQLARAAAAPREGSVLSAHRPLSAAQHERHDETATVDGRRIPAAAPSETTTDVADPLQAGDRKYTTVVTQRIVRYIRRSIFDDRPGSRQAREQRAKAIREDWRIEVTSRDESLGNTIEAQLKRLRIERTFLLSSFVCALAAVIEGNWGMGIAFSLLAAMSALLVEERFSRYLGAIVRAHTIIGLHGEGAKRDPGVGTGASA